MEDFYKYNRAYLIRFRKFDDGKTTYLNNYVLPNLAKLLDAEVHDCIAIEEDENQKDVLILFLEDAKIIEFINFCDEENIIEYHKDISYRLLIHDNLEEVILKMMCSDEFKNVFKKFKSKNHTINSLLDKIFQNSEESLEQFEIDILKNEVAKNKTYNLHNK